MLEHLDSFSLSYLNYYSQLFTYCTGVDYKKDSWNLFENLVENLVEILVKNLVENLVKRNLAAYKKDCRSLARFLIEFNRNLEEVYHKFRKHFLGSSSNTKSKQRKILAKFMNKFSIKFSPKFSTKFSTKLLLSFLQSTPAYSTCRNNYHTNVNIFYMLSVSAEESIFCWSILTLSP